MRKSSDDTIFKRKLIKLLKIFKDHPYMLADFLMKNNAMSSMFRKRLIKASIKDRNTINFIDFSKMIEYYDSILIDNAQKLPPEEYWNGKLSEAISDQKFEDAANIRDYMLAKGYEIKPTQF